MGPQHSASPLSPALPRADRPRADRPSPDRRPVALLLLLAVLLSVAAVLVFDRASAHTSVFLLANFVGPTAQTLLHREGLTVCSTAMGTPGNPICFHGGRMPIPSAVVVLGEGLLGNRYLAVGLFKALLLLLPLLAAMLLACRRLPRAAGRRWLVLALLLLPFLLTPFLADVVNMQVEEGYSYSLLALALALVLFPRLHGTRTLNELISFALAVDALYLSKSSMAPAVAVLTLCFLWPVRRRPAALLLTLVLVLLAPAGWALWQHHASGRYTLGTSLDGINLHKGNNATFLDHYPPSPPVNLDYYDASLNRGLSFPNEWTFNDFHQHAAVAFMRSHPAATAQGDLRKLDIIFFSLRKIGSDAPHGLMGHIESASLLLGRLLLWAALLASLSALLRGPAGRRLPAAAFLLLAAAVALPYVLGFAYTRHVSVLLYPAALLCCCLLELSPPAEVASAL